MWVAGRSAYLDIFLFAAASAAPPADWDDRRTYESALLLLLLLPPGGIAIRPVCWFVCSLVGWLTSCHLLHRLAGDGQTGERLTSQWRYGSLTEVAHHKRFN